MGRGPEVKLEIDTDNYWSAIPNPTHMRMYAEQLADEQFTSASRLFSDLADLWEAKLPKPRMAEPAWGEKVIAQNHTLNERRVWLHVSTNRWRTENGATADWSALIDPVPFTPEAAAALS